MNVAQQASRQQTYRSYGFTPNMRSTHATGVDFYSRNTTDLNQPYKELTTQDNNRQVWFMTLIYV